MRYYRRFFVNVAAMIGQDSVYQGLDVVEKVKLYIEKNYQRNITQELLASLFYVNRSYLSMLFQQREQNKFIDYLNDVRIGKAKELLADTDFKMYKIAKMVGYSNPKYFFRIFKKKAGCTPEEYRTEKRIIAAAK